MVETVARAIHQEVEPWDDFGPEWLKVGRAAIAAVLECQKVSALVEEKG